MSLVHIHEQILLSVHAYLPCQFISSIYARCLFVCLFVSQENRLKRVGLTSLFVCSQTNHLVKSRRDGKCWFGSVCCAVSISRRNNKYNSFARAFCKAETWNQNIPPFSFARVGWIQYWYVIVFEKFRFPPCTRKHENDVFKNSILESVLKKSAFSVTVFIGYVWTETVSATKTDTCVRGLSRMTTLERVWQ